MKKYLNKLHTMSATLKETERKLRIVTALSKSQKVKIKILEEKLDAELDVESVTNVQAKCFELIDYAFDNNSNIHSDTKAFGMLTSLWKVGLRNYLQQEDGSIRSIVISISLVLKAAELQEKFLNSCEGKEILKELSLVAALTTSDSNLQCIFKIVNSLCAR